MAVVGVPGTLPKLHSPGSSAWRSANVNLLTSSALHHNHQHCYPSAQTLPLMVANDKCADAGTHAPVSPSLGPFSFWSDSSWCEVTTCYQLLFLSACIMWKCLRLQDTQPPDPPPPLPLLPNPPKGGEDEKRKNQELTCSFQSS